jgi:hypothetical protein
VVVAVAVVRVVQVAPDEVVDVLPMGNRGVPAVRSVVMIGLMSSADVRRRTGIGVQLVDREHVVIDVTVVVVVQVTVVQVVRVPVVQQGAVAAVGAVDVSMVFVHVMVHVRILSVLGGAAPAPLARVIERAPDEIRDVLIRKRVVDVLAHAAALDEVLGLEEAQLLRDGGEADLFGCRQLGHAPLAVREPIQHAQPRHLPGGAEQASGALEGLRAERRAQTDARRMFVAGRRLRRGTRPLILHQFTNW